MPTLPPGTPREILSAFRAQRADHDALLLRVTRLQEQLGAMPAPLTLDDIQTALQAGGTHPLNLTNLQGTSVGTAQTQAAIPRPDPVPQPQPIPPPGTPPPVIPPPIPPPPGPPPPGGGGIDMIPLSSIVVVNSPPLSAMTNTAKMTAMNITGTGFGPVFTTQNSWPDIVPPGWTGPLQFTLWMVLNIGGQWYASGIVQFWRGLAEGGGPPNQVGINWFYGTAWGPMSGHQPAVGETIGMLVTAGNQRQGSNNFVVAERSNVVSFPYPSASGGSFTFS